VHLALDASPARSASDANSTNGVAAEEAGSKKRKGKKGSAQVQPEPPTPKPNTTFTPDDILNIAPIVKDAAPRSALAEEALEAGKISLAQGQKQLGQELILESLSLHEQIYGILHPEVAKMYHSLSTIYYQTDEKEAAVELARKAVIVTERTLGVDSSDAILSYLNLSLFEHHVGNTKQALKYVRHALDVWKLIFGPNHPDSITTLNNAAVMLQSLKEYSESRRWFEACYTVCEGLFGRQTINAATILFQLAQALALDGEAKGAVNKMRDAYNIFLTELGPSDRNTKEAESWLEQLTQNAVNIAKQAKVLQNRRLGGAIRQLPRFGTRLQPQNASSAAPNTDARSVGSEPNVRTGSGNLALDSRSIDELLKYIEGGETSSSPRSKQKKKSLNPKARSSRKTASA
jgi:protein TIF31